MTVRSSLSILCASLPSLVGTAGLGVLLAACEAESTPAPPPPRPVTYVAVERSIPAATALLSGTVESWKREEIGFRVPGRVRDVVDPGTDIAGQTVDEKGRRVTEGTEIAGWTTTRSAERARR